MLVYIFSLGLLRIPCAVLLVCFLVAGVVVIDHFFLSPEYPDGVDLIREPPGARRFSVQTRLAYYTDCRALYKEAWTKVSLEFMVPEETLTAQLVQYSKQGRIVVVPGLGFRSDVILPPSLYQWAQSLPEEDFSIHHAISDMYSV